MQHKIQEHSSGGGAADRSDGSQIKWTIPSQTPKQPELLVESEAPAPAQALEESPTKGRDDTTSMASNSGAFRYGTGSERLTALWRQSYKQIGTAAPVLKKPMRVDEFCAHAAVRLQGARLQDN